MLLIVGTFIGGLGLFLLAVSMITDGLKLAAGDGLRSILARSTRTRLRGVGSGVLITAIVQSSSAVTVATIGFVNAGLLTLSQSLGVVYGSNIGTTMTGWIVAAVGFSFRVEAFALPLIGIGMLARTLNTSSRAAAIGEALAGFGLFFIGVDLLKDAFEVFSARVDVAGFAPQGGLGLMLYAVLGFFMTLVTQSSSAAIAITLTAATGGVLGLNAAAAMVIGANVGTTSTAALAVIGATANARRVAAAHVIFNLLTGLVALLLLPLLLWLVRSTGEALGLADIPAVSLALFHTVFNALGVALMWPLTPRLSTFLSERFSTDAERLAQPQFLDRNVLATPLLAVDALRRELARLTALVCDHAVSTLSAEAGDARASRQQGEGLQAVIDAVENVATDAAMEKLPESSRGDLPNALRISGYLEEVIGLLAELDERRPDIAAIMQGEMLGPVADFQAAVVAHVRLCDPQRDDGAAGDLDSAYATLRSRWRELKGVLLTAAAARKLPVSRLNTALEGLRAALKVAEQLGKATQRLRTLGMAPAPAAEAVEAPPAPAETPAQPADRADHG